MSVVSGKDFAQYLPKIVPSLFRLIETLFIDDRQNEEKDDDEDKKINIQTYDTGEAEIAINMLGVIMGVLKELFADYVQKTSEIVMPLVNYSSNDYIRISAAKCLPVMVKCAKTRTDDGAQNITRAFIKVLADAIETEYSPNVIGDQIMAMKQSIDECGTFLSQNEVTDFSQIVFRFLMESDKRKSQDEKIKEQDDIDEDEVKLIEEDQEIEEDL